MIYLYFEHHDFCEFQLLLIKNRVVMLVNQSKNISMVSLNVYYKRLMLMLV